MPDPGPAPVPEELPVEKDYDPTKTRTLPAGVHVVKLGEFILRTSQKVAADFTSDSCLPVGKDIEVVAYLVHYPNMPTDKIKIMA